MAVKARAILSLQMDVDIQSHGTLRSCTIITHALVTINCWHKDDMVVSSPDVAKQKTMMHFCHWQWNPQPGTTPGIPPRTPTPGEGGDEMLVEVDVMLL